MFIETKEIGPEGLTLSRTIEPFTLASGPAGDELRLEKTRVTGDLYKDEGGVSFRGRIETSARLTCSRCLEEHAFPLDLPFDLVYTTEPESVPGSDHRMDDDLVTRVPFEGDRIDLRALVSEQVYLGLPLKPLCRPDCLGLCPRCGTNLNRGECACAETRTEDPRLRVLKNLL